MPRRKAKAVYKEDSDSDFVEESKDDNKGDAQVKDDDDYSVSSAGDQDDQVQEKLEAVNDEAAPVAISKRTKKRKRKSYEATDESFLTSNERKTKNGGYAHTNNSKSKISKANSGNTPWNKGRNRSSADKAKIAAGVRARNRAILLEKLKRLGMSEEEYNQKKREIKYLRERIRRAKAANAKYKTTEAELKLMAAIDATTEKSTPAKKAQTPEVPDESAAKAKEKTAAEKPKDAAGKEVFSRDIAWTPFSFGDDAKDSNQVCPEGGPGGLICCEFCSKSYSSYLSQTVKDMEIQRTHKAGKEVKELLKFIDQGRKTLERAYDVAKKKVPPVPPPTRNVETTKPQTRKSSSSKNNPEPAEWNLTSTLDIAFTGGVTAV